MLQGAELKQFAVRTLDDNKAMNIVVLDVRTLTNITDYLVICSATSKRHACALGDKLATAVKEQGFRPLSIEGQETGEWILMDLADVIVHIMLPECRDFYGLEKLWNMSVVESESA